MAKKPARSVYKYVADRDCYWNHTYYKANQEYEINVDGPAGVPCFHLRPIDGGPSRDAPPNTRYAKHTPMTEPDDEPATLSEMSAKKGRPLGAPAPK